MQLCPERSVPCRPPHFFGRTRHRNRGCPWDSALPAATAPLLVRFSWAPKWGQQAPRAQTRLLGRRLQFLQRVGFPISALLGAKHVWEIFVSHWLPPPPRGGTPARVPKPLPCLGSPQAAVAASFKVQVQYCCNFSGKFKKKKKKLRAGGSEGERAKGRCRGVKDNPTSKRGSCVVLYLSREGYHRAASQAAWGQPACMDPGSRRGSPGRLHPESAGPGARERREVPRSKETSRLVAAQKAKRGGARALGGACPLPRAAEDAESPLLCRAGAPPFLPTLRGKASQLWPRIPPLTVDQLGGCAGTT